MPALGMVQFPSSFSFCVVAHQAARSFHCNDQLHADLQYIGAMYQGLRLLGRISRANPC